MADVTVEAGANPKNWQASNRCVVFTTSEIGYLFYIDSAIDLLYKKTTDGGATWSGTGVIVRTGTVDCFDIWYDKWTPGNTGTLIHIAYQDSTVDDILYRNLDTAASDVLNPTVASSAGGTVVFNGATFTTLALGTWDEHSISITRARGGNLYIISNPDAHVEHGLYRSTDVGANWTTRTFPALVAGSLYLLFPANTDDPQDAQIIRWKVDTASAPVSLVYDDSANGSSSTTVGSGQTGSITYAQISGSVRHSDNHVLLAQWNALDSAFARLRLYDLDANTVGAGGTAVVTKTDIIVDTAEYAQCSVFIDQNTGHIYVSYLGGSTWATNAHVYYKKSTDGGTTWGTETQIDFTLDDSRAVWSGLGGTTTRFIPVWQNDDLDDIYVNKDNSIVIAPAGGRTTKNTRPRPLGIFAGMGRRQVGVPL